MELGYYNGKFVGLDEKVVPIDERGHQFGDGVYEVIRFYDGKPFMMTEHLERLIRSANDIKLQMSEGLQELNDLILEGVAKSQLKECSVYLQITRGIASRNHLFPNVPVSIAMTIREAKPLSAELREKGVATIILEDERWANCYIKSLNLLPNILAKQTAHEAGCYEAILVRDGYVTEGTSSNVFIVKNGCIITTPLHKHILPGITRMAVKNIAEQLNIPFEEKYYSPEELLQADEIFITSTTAEVLPVVKVDKTTIGSGTPGKLTSSLYGEFQKVVEAL
ncbi:D-amino-acid transaminase [Bacillus dakarensis]|uniref:D-amino-acid transaminase n=1 Tax=Robertmurraya dakarensis TaxID=1926278 RepID=UPI000980EE33|nr:D-amino-acid transaminase [Bacillus dakarensis]